MRRLEGKVAVITGAGSGIARATAKKFVECGAKVVIAEINKPLGKEISDELGSAATFVETDVTDDESVKHVMATAAETFGKIDILHNNAASKSKNPNDFYVPFEEFEFYLAY